MRLPLLARDLDEVQILARENARYGLGRILRASELPLTRGERARGESERLDGFSCQRRATDAKCYVIETGQPCLRCLACSPNPLSPCPRMRRYPGRFVLPEALTDRNSAAGKGGTQVAERACVTLFSVRCIAIPSRTEPVAFEDFMESPNALG